MEQQPKLQQELKPRRFSWTQVLLIVIGTILITLVTAIVAAQLIFYPKPFTPVTLRPEEQTRLEAKLGRLDAAPLKRIQTTEQQPANDKPLLPEAYREDPAARSVRFSERELNSLLATNTNMAERVAIDLSQDLISLNMLIPVDPDFPMLGGKTLKIKAGLELAYRQEQPVVIFRGISVMGVPLPKAWLGNIKNMDLIQEFGLEDGFWKSFADGIQSLSVDEGALELVLNE